ncbi:MAG: lysophospholipid acyltransferase family protein [Gloeobacteraceae cyanobacterium ES-bin-144]|nr:lysophospholipid acyltransferase family protein [Verrucomicrobiales bacterium]
MSSKKGTEIRSDRKSAMLGTLIGWLMKSIVATLRLEVRDLCGISSSQNSLPPVIYILWHNRFFTVPAAWNKICGNHRQCVALTSASHDGDMVARAMAVFGLGAVRGSSSRRGVAALVGLKRALQEGLDVCLTPDGPRGPRYIIQPGVIKLAEATGAPIVPIHVAFSSAWRLKTWDRFVIPKPFSRVIVTFSESIHLTKGIDVETFESERLKIETLLVNGTDDAQ